MKAANDAAPFGRIVRWMVILAAVGIVASLGMGGPRGAFSFAAGALISTASFWSLHYLGGVLTKPNPSTPSLAFLMLRLVIVAGVAYGILNVYEVLLRYVVAGLLLSVVAITFEALHEFWYARA